jgi:hypothetical protein
VRRRVPPPLRANPELGGRTVNDDEAWVVLSLLAIAVLALTVIIELC